MNFDNFDILLNNLLDKNIRYEEVLEIAQDLVSDIPKPHSSIQGITYPSAISQCILECFRKKYGFSSSVWVPIKQIEKVELKENARLIKFSRVISENKIANYELYNSDDFIVKEEFELNDSEKVSSKQISKEEIKPKNLSDSEKNKPTQMESSSVIKKVILACIKEFPNKYGKSGISKILKGSQGIKINEHNNDTLNSEFYGIFSHLTLDNITSEIEELIQNEMLVIKKVSFGRPILSVAPKFLNTIQDLSEFDFVGRLKNSLKNKDNSLEENIYEEDTDENILKILHLINSSKNIFITGHAGTGKSYILNRLKEKLGKKLVITSTTGIAAVNVKGQTLHSWAGVGICNSPIEHVVEKILKKSSIKNQIQKCKILAIDEISMLDIKTFEYVDAVLKQIRSNEKPFGGIQVIFIGDFFQLPPVEKNEGVQSKYCFESKLWEDFDLYTVLLTKNYRQNEENLITALANMRTNSLTKEDINLLKTRESQEFDEVQNVLHIFATNFEADNYNKKKFMEISSPEYKLVAIDGVYRGDKLVEQPTNLREENILKRIDAVCRAEKLVSLKLGARVMLLINLDFEKGLINGSCGEVREISDNSIEILFDNGVVSKISRHDFEFYNNEVLIAVRKQFPIRLAYGITIHKSQGMSLDKLVVDCSRIFEKGQAYVALSRIKTLQGLYLYNFSPNRVMVDEKVVEFYRTLKIFNENLTN